MTEVPHFDYPFRRGLGGFVAEVEQDTVDEIANCVRIIVQTPKGSRVDLPEFGIPDTPLQENGPDLQTIKTALTEWEPRASYALDETDLEDALSKKITINVTDIHSDA